MKHKKIKLRLMATKLINKLEILLKDKKKMINQQIEKERIKLSS